MKSIDCDISQHRSFEKSKLKKITAQFFTYFLATINPSQPRTFGNVEIHLSNIDYLTPNAVSPIVRVPQPKIKAEEDAIGTFIAEQLVDDEATLQLGKCKNINYSIIVGIGSIPDAVLSKLGNHKNLGIHTEMISDGVIPLFEKGVVNNSKKTVDPGKSVLCFAMGSDKFYKFLDGNTDFCKLTSYSTLCNCLVFGSTGYTNDVHTIALNHRMTGINSAIEIDLTGQAVSDTIGTSIFSGMSFTTITVYISVQVLEVKLTLFMERVMLMTDKVNPFWRLLRGPKKDIPR